MYVAGGTDLLPNLKHHLHTPQHLVSLSEVVGLDQISMAADGTLEIGASATLHAIATSELLAREVPGLAQAAGLVAGPQHRQMGTIGGNVMLDTRCLFYNQTAEWRTALGYCLKKDGDWCHVIGSGTACVAAQSSDTVPMLVALNARIRVRTTESATEEVALRKLFTKDGRFEKMHTLPHTALVEAILIGPRQVGHRSVYRKVRSRAAVDYPQLGVAISGSFHGPICTSLEVVIGAVMPQPKRLKHMRKAVGQRLDDDLIEVLATHGFKAVKPQTSIHGSPEWRRNMVKVELARGLRAFRPN
jgi:4-hydroxybenzoyl-CoA reductase subunit beta